MSGPFDICIVGSGAAGLYLAERLSRESALRIALVEAGPKSFADRKESFVVQCTGRQHAGVNTARVTSFGGATNTWGGGLIRLAEGDLAAHPGMPHTKWPLSHEELCTAYEEVEADLRISLPRDFLDRTLYPVDGQSFRQRLATILPFWRKNFSRTLGPRVLQRPNLSAHFSAGSLLSAKTAADAVTALEFEDGTRIEARRFVIAAGVVNSNVIVQRIFRGAGLEGRPPALGSGFHDHLSIPLFTIRPSARYAFSKRFSYKFARTLMLAEHYETERNPGSGAPPHASAFIHFAFELSRSSTLKLLKQGLERLQRPSGLPFDFRALKADPAALVKLAAAWAVHHSLYIPEDVDITAVLDLEQVPFPEWRLSDADTAPRLDWDIHERDIDNARHYAIASIGLMDRLSSEAAFSYEPLFPEPAKGNEEFAAFVHRHATDTYHGAGGVRMGADPSDSVASRNLALHAFPNVYVASTAVFPRVGAGNPTLTVLALTRRLADHLLSHSIR